MFEKKKPHIDFDKPIPSPEEVCTDYAAALTKKAEIEAAQRRVEDENRAVLAEIAADRTQEKRDNEVSAILAGADYELPTAARERVARLQRQRDLLRDAYHDATVAVAAAHRKASAKIVERFVPEQEALAKEFFGHLAAAVAVHSRFGAMKQRLESAGVDSAGLYDFGREVLGVPNRTNDHAAYAMRDGVRRGYIAERDVPVGYLK